MARDEAEVARRWAEIHQSFALKPKGFTPGSFQALVTEYKASQDYSALAPGTRQDYARYLDYLSDKLGSVPVKNITRGHVLKVRDKRNR
jgi:hypothetical protein